MYIYQHHHHHQVALLAQFSLTLPPSLPFCCFVPVTHRSKQVFQTTPCVHTELLSVSSSWSTNSNIYRECPRGVNG